MRLPTFDDILEAAERIESRVLRTPILRSAALDEQVGATLLIKPECLQQTGSFKLRGAYNRMLKMSSGESQAGVVAWSAGNHGQALAYAGKELGIAVTIVMPSDAPDTKIERTRRWGAEVVLYDRMSESREEIGRAIANAKGAVIVPPFDDADVIAGQGTIGLEFIQQTRAMGLQLSHILCPVGGGGLIAGCALAAEGLRQTVSIHPVEPLGYDDTARSIAHGELMKNDLRQPSICDALMTVTPGDITFAVNRERLAAGITVTDSQVRHAIKSALTELKIVTEPGGVAALAAALSHSQLFRGATVGIMLTGGNLDMESLSQAALGNH